jgi:hypothetical protein
MAACFACAALPAVEDTCSTVRTGSSHTAELGSPPVEQSAAFPEPPWHLACSALVVIRIGRTMGTQLIIFVAARRPGRLRPGRT